MNAWRVQLCNFVLQQFLKLRVFTKKINSYLISCYYRQVSNLILKCISEEKVEPMFTRSIELSFNEVIVKLNSLVNRKILVEVIELLV